MKSVSMVDPDPWSDVLVWISEPPRQHTYWITRSGRQFSVQGERRGVFFAGDSRLWMWEPNSLPITLAGSEDPGVLGSAGRLESARLIDLETGAVAEVSAERYEGPWRAISDAVMPIFSVGNMLFATHRRWGDPPRAAHPSEVAYLLCIDLESGRPTRWADDAEATGLAHRLEHVAPSGETAVGDPWRYGPAAITKFDPVYTDDGTLHIDYQLTAPASYIARDGIWDSYSRSTTVRSAEVPSLLEAYRTLPEAARWFICGHAPRSFGWTAVAPHQREKLLKTFRERTDLPGSVAYSLHCV